MFGGSPAFEEPMPMSSDEAEAWYEQVSSDPNPLHWAIELQGRFVGTARLHTSWMRPTGAPAMPWAYWIASCSGAALADK